MKQEAPATLKIELTEGCNLRCGMCGIQGIREKAGGPYKFMEVVTADKLGRLVAAAKWNSKIEMAMRGEPLMNPQAAEIIATLRSHLPCNQIMMTSNGTPLLRSPGAVENAMTLFDAGLNVLAIDCYRESAKVEAQLRVAIHDGTFTARNVKAFDYPCPENESPYNRYPVKQRTLFLIEDFEKASMEGIKVGVKKASNHCGAGLPPNLEPIAKRCARPFREMAFRHDGQVALCCNDWRGAYHIGSYEKAKDILDLWDGPALHAARVLLYASDRDFSPCDRCDNISYRVGLLPDHKGQTKLPKPSAQIIATAKSCSNRKTMTLAVLRPWEKPSAKGLPKLDTAIVHDIEKQLKGVE